MRLLTTHRRRALGCAGGLAGLLLLFSCRSQPDTELRQALDQRYPEGWRYATLRADLISELHPGESPSWISGDFDGDGQLDYAAQVVIFRPGHTLAVDSAQLLLALLRREHGFAHHVLSVGGGPHQGIYLSRIGTGSTVQSFEGGPAVGLPADAVHQIFANQASMAFVYDQGGWTEIATAD